MAINELRFLAMEARGAVPGSMLKLLVGLGASKISVALGGVAALQLLKAPHAQFDVVLCGLAMTETEGLAVVGCLGEAGLPVSLILTQSLTPEAGLVLESRIRGRGVRLLGALPTLMPMAALAGLIELHRQVRSNTYLPRAAHGRFRLRPGVAC